MYFLIYKITNNLNNKIYVGAHKTENRDDDYFGSGKVLARAIEKYGKEKFHKEILLECKTEEEMWQSEANIVDEEFVARDDTYNIKVGGFGGFDYINKSKKNIYENHNRTENFRKSVSVGVKKWWREKSEEERKEYALKTSVQRRLYIEKNGNPFFGKKHTEESKEKMRKARVGRFGGENNPSYGTTWITNGINNKKVKKDAEIPVGWKKGRISK